MYTFLQRIERWISLHKKWSLDLERAEDAIFFAKFQIKKLSKKNKIYPEANHRLKVYERWLDKSWFAVGTKQVQRVERERKARIASLRSNSKQLAKNKAILAKLPKKIAWAEKMLLDLAQNICRRPHSWHLLEKYPQLKSVLGIDLIDLNLDPN